MTNFGRKVSRYSDSFKKFIVKQAIDGPDSAYELSTKYKVGTSTIYRWLDQFGLEMFTLAIEANQDSITMKKKEVDPQELRINELEEALRIEQLKVEAYKRMIKLAEEKYKVIIEKKNGSKRSKI